MGRAGLARVFIRQATAYLRRRAVLLLRQRRLLLLQRRRLLLLLLHPAPVGEVDALPLHGHKAGADLHAGVAEDL